MHGGRISAGYWAKQDQKVDKLVGVALGTKSADRVDDRYWSNRLDHRDLSGWSSSDPGDRGGGVDGGVAHLARARRMTDVEQILRS